MFYTIIKNISKFINYMKKITNHITIFFKNNV